MKNSGYIQIYHDLIRSSEVINSPISYRWVLLTIIDRTVYETSEYNAHGKIIVLNPGQFACTSRELAGLANVSEPAAYRAIKYFEKLKIVKQEVKHGKTILTVLWGIKHGYGETTSETKVKQDRNINKETKKSKKVVCMFVRAGEEAQEKNESPLIVVKSRKQSSVETIKKDELVKALKEEAFSEGEILGAIKIMLETDPTLNTNGSIQKYVKGIIVNQRNQNQIKEKEKNYGKSTRQQDSVQRSRESLTKSSVRYKGIMG